jgi:hypothetical protein
MNVLGKYVALLLVALWLPATLHCRVESSLGLAQCAETAASCHGEATCPDAVMAATPQASVKVASVSVPAAKSLHDFFQCADWDASSAGDRIEQACSSARHITPLELSAAWQFIVRAAPLARAPSLVG